MAMLVAFMPLAQVAAQTTMQVPYGGDRPAPVPITPSHDPKDTPEEIAKDAARDLRDNSFYNKPGATRAQYDADWQDCRLIARGSRTPSGTVPYYYNPAVISPLAAGMGGALGGLIAGAIAEGQQRRANRRACLLIKGWRLVELPSADAARLATMTDEQRSSHFNTLVGAAQVDGKVTERTRFSLAPDPALKLDAPVAGPTTVFLGKKIDPATPVVLAPTEAAVVLAFRRPDAASAGRSGAVQLSRYNLAARDLVYQPKDWKKTGDKTSYLITAGSADRTASYEVQVLRVTAGDYIVSGMSVGPMVVTTTYCFGAPTFHVDAGDVVYIGDFVPLWNARKADGQKLTALAYTAHIDDARHALATSQPALAAALKPAVPHNRATYACSAISMDRWDLPGADALPDLSTAAVPQQASPPNASTNGGTVTAHISTDPYSARSP